MLIGELAREVGVSRDTIRYYNELNLLIFTERKAGSRIYREYSSENISRIQMIRSAKNMGFTLSDLQKILVEYESGEISDNDIVILLRERLKLVRKKMKSLQITESLLVDKLEKYK